MTAGKRSIPRKRIIGTKGTLCEMSVAVPLQYRTSVDCDFSAGDVTAVIGQ